MGFDCLKCMGKHYSNPLKCGHNYCPISSKINSLQGKKLDKKEFVGTAPGVFIGRYNYPKINVGILAPPEKIEKDAELYESPNEWSKRDFEINDVLKFRSVIINSSFQSYVKTNSSKILSMSQEVAMASKPVDLEFNLDKKPYYNVKTSEVETVMGARAELRKAVLQENPKIDKKVDYVVSDNDLKSVGALSILYKKGYDENFLTNLLSIGTLGLKPQRKLVPTRWSITAVDDTLGKDLIEEIKDYKEIDCKLYFGGYLGNYYLIMFFPRVWSYELFEMYMPETLWNPNTELKVMTDHEFYEGRKKYADNCVGGYYASRLGVLEKFKSLKKQGAVLVLRFITNEYTMPLGVWVVREATRKALEKERDFDSKEEMIKFAKDLLLKKFNYNIDVTLKKSRVYDHINKQKTLKDFFKA